MGRAIIQSEISQEELLQGIHTGRYSHLAEEYHRPEKRPSAESTPKEPEELPTGEAKEHPATEPAPETKTEPDAVHEQPEAEETAGTETPVERKEKETVAPDKEKAKGRKRESKSGIDLRIDKSERSRIKSFVSERHIEKIKVIAKVKFGSTRPGICNAIIDDILRRYLEEHREELEEMVRQYKTMLD